MSFNDDMKFLISDAFMLNLVLVGGFTVYITVYPFDWLVDLLEVRAVLPLNSPITSLVETKYVFCV